MSPYRTRQKLQALAPAFLKALLFSILLVPAAQAYDGVSVGHLKTARVEGKETMMDIAQKYQIGYAQLMAANPGIDPWLPGRGREILIPDWHLLPDTVHQGIVLNTGELRVYYYPPDGSAPKTFPIGIGREGLTTPLGVTKIVSKTKDPSWRPTPRMRLEDPKLPAVVEGGDPDNPLGAYALYLGWPSYRMHGTNHEKAIGRRASSGCIRLYRDDITWMYQNVPVGTKVTSVKQPIKTAWINNEFFVEAEPTDMQIDELEYQNRQITVNIPNGTIEAIRRKAGDQGERIDWEKLRTVLIQRTGVPTQVTYGPEARVPVEKAVAHVDSNPVAEDQVAEPAPIAHETMPKAKQSQRPAPAPHRNSSDWNGLNGD